MKRVKRSYCEVPFAISFEGRWIVGKIDRLVEIDDGSWVVVDYKSEAVGPEEYALAANDYRISMRVYCEAARELVKYEKIAGFLYFTETGEFVPMSS